MKLKITFLLFFVTTTFFAQTLTISSNGDAGTSGTNWSSSGTNPVIISATGNANINTSVIVGYLNAGASVTLQSSQDLVLANSIVVGVLPNDVTLALKANKDIFINSNVFIDATQNSNINKLDIILHSDSDGTGYSSSCACSSSAGAIQINDGGGLKSNGGSIILGGGLDIITGSAWATGVSTDYTGINLINTTINSAGGAITMRSKGNHATGKSLGIMLNAGTDINSGSGKINIFGRSESFVGDNSGQFKNGIRFNGTSVNPITIMSSNTDSDAIILSGQEGYWTGNINTSGGSGNYREGLSFVYTNITSNGGVTFAADKQIYNNTTVANTGGLNITSYESNSFWEDFIWNGTLSGSSFVGSSSIAGLTINDMENLGGLTLGKTTSISDITVNAEINIAGSINIYGGDINLNENLISTKSGADVLLKASDNIALAASKSILTNGGDITLWSNSDDTGDNGHILLRDGSSITTNAGHVWFGGGSGTTTWNGLTVGDGYATAGAVISSDTFLGSNQGDIASGIYLENTSINTGGGDFAAYGEGDDIQTTGERGILSIGDLSINSGSGKIYLDAKSNNEISLIFGHHSGHTSSEVSALASSNTAIDAITVNTVSQNSGSWSYGTWVEGTTTVQATNGGGIVWTTEGTAKGINLGYSLLSAPGVLNLLANSGDITLNTKAKGINIQTTGEINLGKKAETSVTTSSSNINVIADDFTSSGTNIFNFNTSGKINIAPQSGNSFVSIFDTSSLSYSSDVSGLTIGHNDNNGDVTIGNNTVISGDINIYGGDISVSDNLDTSSASDGDILLKAIGNITQASSKLIVTDGGDITLWSNSDNNGGYIYLKDNVTLDSRTSADRTANNGSSDDENGGAITLGGGSGTTTPTGFAFSTTGGIGAGIQLGESANSGISIISGGGDISLKGKSDDDSGNGESNGIFTYGGFSIDGGKTGSISLNGQGENGSYNAGIYTSYQLSAGNNLIKTVDGNISLIGASNGGGTSGDRGILLLSNALNSTTIESTGTGSITINANSGSSSNASHDIFTQNEINILAKSGSVEINGSGNGNIQPYGNTLTIGYKSGSDVTSSNSDITLTEDSLNFSSGIDFNTSGTLNIRPTVGNSFINTLSTSQLSYSSDVSGLTIGHADNTSNITFGSNTTIAGGITLYGGDITINNKLEATDSTITLDGSGTITDGTNGYLVADNLLLTDGTVTLDNVLNNVTTIAANDLDAITYVNAEALEIGSVSNVDGVTATGSIDIATVSGDLTLSQNVSTLDGSNSAIILNAGKSETADTATGGDIIVSGAPTITFGTNGIAKLFSGSEVNSTGLSALAGGSSNTRFGVDETTISFDPVLVMNNAYALYREALTLNILDLTLAKVKLYPNPSQAGYTHFMLQGLDGSATIALYNTLGQRIPVSTKTINNGLQVTPNYTLSSGMYLVLIKTEEQTSQLKWLVE